MMDESDGDFARGIELPNLDASRLFGVDVPHARGSDTGANAAEESRRIAAFDHAFQDSAGAFAGLVEPSAPLLGGGLADHRQLVERFEGVSRRQIASDWFGEHDDEVVRRGDG